MKKAAERIDRAIAIIETREPFFYNLINHLAIVETEKETQTAATDGRRLIYNKKFIDKLTMEELCAVLLHELLHNVFMHISRKKKRQMDPWNAATDYAINPIVQEYFRLPEKTLLDYKYLDMTAEEIYNTFPKKKVKLQGWCSKDGWDKKGGQGMASEEWKELVSREINENYGKLPGGLKRFIDKTFYVPVVDWKSLLADILTNDSNDFIFSKRDRRFMNSSFFLPDNYSEEKLKDVVLCYDTSGSITREMLNSFYKETLNILSGFPQLQGYIAVCDAALHAFYEVDARQDTLENIRYIGGGGTSFVPPFKEIQKRGIRPKAMFYFTDTYGDFPDKPDFPVYWLVPSYIGDSNRESVPWGEVIKFLPK